MAHKMNMMHHINKRERGTWVRGNYHALLGWIGYTNRYWGFKLAGGQTTFYIK